METVTMLEYMQNPGVLGRVEQICPADKTGNPIDCGGCEEHLGKPLTPAQQRFRADWSALVVCQSP